MTEEGRNDEGRAWGRAAPVGRPRETRPYGVPDNHGGCPYRGSWIPILVLLPHPCPFSAFRCFVGESLTGAFVTT